jgi:hypothetical protein
LWRGEHLAEIHVHSIIEHAFEHKAFGWVVIRSSMLQSTAERYWVA